MTATLIPRPWPTATSPATTSSEQPAFGLRCLRPVPAASTQSQPESQPETANHYDPHRQLTVRTTDGTPLIDTPDMPQMVTHQNTQADHQWFTDKDN